MIGDSIAPAIGILPSPQVASTVNGPAIPRPSSYIVVAMTGATTGAPSSFTATFKVQDSDDGTTGWADLDAGGLTVLTTINTMAELNMSLTPKPFLRVVSVVAFVAGTAPALQVAAVVITGDRTRPS